MNSLIHKDIRDIYKLILKREKKIINIIKHNHGGAAFYEITFDKEFGASDKFYVYEFEFFSAYYKKSIMAGEWVDKDD